MQESLVYKLRRHHDVEFETEAYSKRTKFRLPKLVLPDDETPKSSPRDTYASHPLFKYDFRSATAEGYYLEDRYGLLSDDDVTAEFLFDYYNKYDVYFAQEAAAEGGGGGSEAKFPRIVLKGVVGQELDTDTSYQRVINEARWRMSMGEQPMDSEDWRLPHSTLPARPDYSREPPPGFVSERLPKREKKRKITTWESLPDLVDAGDIDHKKGLAKLSFNLGQLETLPPLVAAHLLHQEIQRKNQRTYIPFVASAPVYNKAFSATDIRDPVHEIPGFCSGCLRQELCYGCAQEPSKPHYHKDKPSRTGGGFTYFKRDKPQDELFHKNPLHWKEGADPNGYVYYDGDMSEWERYTLRMKVGQVPLVPRPQMNRILEDLMRRHHSKMSRIHAEKVSRDREVTIRLAEQDVYKSRRTNSPQSDVDSGRGATVADSQEMLYRSDLDISKTLGGFSKIQEVSETNLGSLSTHSVTKAENLQKQQEQEEALRQKTGTEMQGSFTIAGTLLPPITAKQKERSQESLMDESLERDSTGKIISRATKEEEGTGGELGQGQQLDGATASKEKPKLHFQSLNGPVKKLMVDMAGELQAGGGSSGSQSSTTESGSNKSAADKEADKTAEVSKLMTAENTTVDDGTGSGDGTGFREDIIGEMEDARQKAGSRSKKPATVARSPFSSNREYSIPTGDGFSPKKSSKSPTKFEDFEHLDRTWNEPKKFELQDAEKHSIEPWMGLKEASKGSVDKEVQEEPPIKVETPPTSVEEEREASRPGSVDSGVASQPPTDRAEDGATTKFESTLAPVPPTPSSGQRSRLSHGSRGSQLLPGVEGESPLRVDGEGTFISRSESVLKREKTEVGGSSAGSRKTRSAQSKEENGSVRSSHTIASVSVTIQHKEPTPETIESTEPTQEEFVQEHEELVIEEDEPQQEVSPIQEVVVEEEEEEEVQEETDEAKPKAPVLDWSKFKKGALHYSEEEDKKQADEVASDRDKQKSRATVQSQKTDKSKDSTKEKKKKEPVVKKESKKERKRVKGKKKVEKGTKEQKKAGKGAKQKQAVIEGESEDEEEVEEEAVEDFKLAPIKEFVPKAASPPPTREVEPPPLPKLEPVTPPELPDYDNPERPSREVSKTLIEAPPMMPEPPKQRRPADLKRVPKRKRDRKRVLPSENVAPISKQQLKTITNPLDYLAKYCIIHPDRLPHYERVFNTMMREQVYRYSDVPHPEGFALPVPPTPSSGDSPTKGHLSPLKTVSPTTKTDLSPHEKMMIKDLSVITRATKPEYGIAGMNEGDQLVAKLNYTLDTLIDKYEHISDKLDDLQANRVSILAKQAIKEFAGIDEVDYVPPGAKKKKKKKKDKSDKKAAGATAEIETQTEDPASSQGAPTEVETARMGVSDLDIVSRLDQKMLNQLTNDTVASMEIEIRRLQEKLKEVDDRIEYLEDEKKLFQLFARDEFQEDQGKEVKPKEFSRKQSALYNKMHPPVDAEMNLTELEEALQQLNTNLISEKEMQYIYHILDIPGRKRINVQLFSVIAALSEKVAQVDPLIKKLINKFDFEALDVKMEKCKGLFDLLDEDDFDIPSGMIKAKNLVIELAAGGIAPENTSYIESKFNRESRGIVDFLDFLTYVPLFIEIHERIIAHPLSRDREL